MIGIYDRDFVEQYPRGFYNIQVMKLCGYFKKTNQAFEMLTERSRFSYFSKVYYFQNWNYSFPKEALESNVEARGLSISKTYIPLPIEIEKCLPDPSIYQRVFSRKNLSEEEQTWLDHLDAGYHIQFLDTGLSIEETPIDESYHGTGIRYIYLYDTKFDETINYASILQSKIIGVNGKPLPLRKFSVCYVREVSLPTKVAINLSQCSMNKYTNFIHYNGNMTLKDYGELAKKIQPSKNGLRIFFDYPAVDNFYDEQNMYVSMAKKILISQEFDFPFNICYNGNQEELEVPLMMDAMKKWGKVDHKYKDKTLLGVFKRKNNFNKCFLKVPAIHKYMKIENTTFRKDGELWI